jgi:hypothetical protein
MFINVHIKNPMNEQVRLATWQMKKRIKQTNTLEMMMCLGNNVVSNKIVIKYSGIM